MPTLQTTKTAKVKTKSGYDYEYHYVDLATIDKYLTENGLAYDQELKIVQNEYGDIAGMFVMTQRYSVDNAGNKTKMGDPMVGLPYAPSANLNIQEVGSYTTYVKRYSVAMAFGLATEDDDGAKAKEAQTRKATPKATTAKVVGITSKQLEMLKEHEDNDIVKNALAYYKKAKLEDLTVKEASTIIARVKEG